MTPLEQKLKSLEFFKDWSNYLLVTTVAALGWVSSKDTLWGPQWARYWCIWSFGASCIFAIFTLAAIPLVGEEVVGNKSIYDVGARYNPLWILPSPVEIKLKWVCWPQHILFLAGIILYVIGTSSK
jgi:hypothetical protein